MGRAGRLQHEVQPAQLQRGAAVDPAVGRDQASLRAYADTWGWQETANDWREVVARDDIDVVYVSTPWEWHVPMALKAMEHGKHVFIEVSAAVTVDECWQLVDMSEKTQRHCAIIENCS